ncbi:restriction endonuclease [Pseudovibrio sp. Tun.PSC04-5.I4]|uniref:restriction endonuclease n=1 Tax=Pseudovibrio sp. Tun.PSC04-5.I4 TaxID=1798213 RepID=UPI00088883A4|nr:restriction endonuclease [Pseudovibrio sp. Tun.PSC04-5.I4]SDQ14988.1 restriction system protein [Pseudovibrio sp. Tun.PSC04-5.I4]SDQ35728.1 restriction system protein [Pseudovibrio sp. Tun.PSC04-5.I4]SDQ35885.1 restriction system protein [Pseudovibrio sp. Tun.PSC04-5.I4]
MVSNPTVWGVHMGVHVSDRPIEGGYVGIGWLAMGDLTKIGASREAFKTALVAAYPDKKTGAIPVDAGSMFKFLHKIKADDIVVYPSKFDRMVNIGRFTGKAIYVPDDHDEYPTHQKVEWLGHFPRDEFSQTALNEIGSFLTMFRVRRHANEFLRKVNLMGDGTTPDAAAAQADAQDDIADDDTATVSATIQAETSTSDFVIKRLMKELSGHQFEELIAHLLECMGYTARVTPKSGDGGVDVIAHMDPLGFQPPIVKVQCKRTTSQTSRPDVDQLLGTLGDGEYGLFINLGSFARGAVELERNRAKLRLINGEQLVMILFENYANLAPRYRVLVPLKQIFVPDLTQE